MVKICGSNMEDKVLFGLTIVCTLFFIVNAGLSATGGAILGVVFNNQKENVSDDHPTLITPIGWTFMVWKYIFLYLGAALIYLTWILRRKKKNDDGEVMINPPVFTRAVAIIFIINQALYTSWLYVWDLDLMTTSAAILLTIAGTNWITFTLIARNLRKATPYLSSPKDVWYYRILVQNSFGMYTTWTTLDALLNESIAVIYEAHVSNLTASLLSLGVLSAIVLCYFIADICCMDGTVRYVITPYLTLIWGLTGTEVSLSMIPSSNPMSVDKEPVVYFVTTLLVILGLLTVLKICTTILRHLRRSSESFA